MIHQYPVPDRDGRAELMCAVCQTYMLMPRGWTERSGPDECPYCGPDDLFVRNNPEVAA